MRSLGLTTVLVLAAGAILAFVALAGPAMLAFAIPFLGLLPPGIVLQFATGFATTGPLQSGACLAGLLLGRIVHAEPHHAMAAAALATLAGFAWEVAEVGASTFVATGPDFVGGRAAGLVVAILGAALACRVGLRWAKGLALPAVGLAKRKVDR